MNNVLLALALLAQPAATSPPPEGEPAPIEQAAPVPPTEEAATPSTAEEPSAEASLTAADQAFAKLLEREGPLKAYREVLDPTGVLFDAAGGSQPGRKGAAQRFTNFPKEGVLRRTPEMTRAAGTTGSSWGSYNLEQNGVIVATGRYLTTWQRDSKGVWRILAELAAGRALSPAEQAALAAETTAQRGATDLPTQPPRPLRDAFGRPVQPASEEPAKGVEPPAEAAQFPLANPSLRGTNEPAPPAGQEPPSPQTTNDVPVDQTENPDFRNPSSPR